MLFLSFMQDLVAISPKRWSKTSNYAYFSPASLMAREAKPTAFVQGARYIN